MFQLAIISILVIVAFVFMAKRFYRTVKRKGGCSCEDSSQCRGMNMPCRTANCPASKSLKELRPKS